MNTPLFSICHTSARPDKWRAVYDDWMSKAVHPEDVEYVLCIDPRWGFPLDTHYYEYSKQHLAAVDNLVVVQNTGRRCYVDGVNIAASASTGKILIVNADDQFACQDWDAELMDKYQSWAKSEADSFVIEVSTGTPREHGVIMPMPILSRARYEQQGREVMYHEYESMCSDNDFCEHAFQDGVVIDARHLMFPHRHPLFDSAGWKAVPSDVVGWDAVYAAQNRQEATDLGLAILKRRRATKFQQIRKRSIALCYPGDDFRGAMVDSLLDLYAHLIDLDMEILKVRADGPNVYILREEARRVVMQQKPDLCLWLDHDNPLSPSQFDQLLVDLDTHPEVDGISGWCWIHNENKQGFIVSCGEWSPDHLHWTPFGSSFARETELRRFECGGFPCFLMRLSALEKAGDCPFLPIVDNRLEHGLLGEDFAFFLRAEKGGAKFLVDPKVRLPHLKYVAVDPVFPSEGAPTPVKVACMMRVKNEGRWLGRVLKSVKELCGENIFVMEDGSSDDTVGIIQASGATLLLSPFVGMGLDERRDKNWLLAAVKSSCHPDWILMPDGDEELEPDGCKKIRTVLESNPPYDCFALRVLNLWDSLKTARFDGVYGTMARQSLFRANSDLQFKSYYDTEGGKNHVGLHTSNAPGLGVNVFRLAPLNVFLLHYGNMLREDRIRKYLWIMGIDGFNEEEDYYRHTVQGDIANVPADATLKHGGPLDIREIPARLVPDFEVAPQPLRLAREESTAAD
jgi:hypothetical protein